MLAAATASRADSAIAPAHILDMGAEYSTSIPATSPWGAVVSHRVLAPGIVSVITHGHGGIHLDPWRQERMPGVLRQASAWYEEDSEWCKPVVAFARELPQDLVLDAHASLKGAYPEEHEAIFGEQYAVPARRIPEARAFYLRHHDDFIGRAVIEAAQARAEYGVRLGADEVLVVARRGADYLPPRPGSLPWTPDDALFIANRNRVMDHASDLHGYVVDPAVDRAVVQITAD